MDIDSRVTGRTKVAGVIGNPIEHTISPQIHNTISRALGIDMIYVPFRIEKGELGSAIKGMRSLNLIGFNVTIPFKNEVMDHIDEVSREAVLIGAVNTVKNAGGRLFGYNTDADGFYRSFTEQAESGLKDKNVVILGAGGTARAIAVKSALECAGKIHIINRTGSKAAEIVSLINRNMDGIAESHCIDDIDAPDVFRCGDVVINTTSAGMHPDVDNIPIPGCFEFSQNQIVYDVIYNPSETRFLKNARDKGCKTVNGLGMLFYQGIYAYEIWHGIKLPDGLVKDIFNTGFSQLVTYR